MISRVDSVAMTHRPQRLRSGIATAVDPRRGADRTIRIVHRRLNSTVILLCSLVAVALAIFVSRAAARERVRANSGPLLPLWASLDKAREYKGNFAGTRTDSQCDVPNDRKDYEEIKRDYTRVPAPCALSRCPPPEQAFKELAGIVACPAGVAPCSFGDFLDDPDTAVAEEAAWGLQEALNEFMAGELMLGNDRLLQGLRTRFPGTGDDEDADQLSLLRQSAARFREGINGVVERLREHPDSLRSGGGVSPPNPEFPFWVENARTPQSGSGELVENELYRFSDLAQRSALASNSLGKRLFFFGNATPEGRQAAIDALKGSAEATYLHTAVLSAVQSSRDFQTNNGYELKRQVVDAQRVFEDIVGGFNPLKLVGDFVPPPDLPVDTLLSNASDSVRAAIDAEADARSVARQFDTDKTTLANELLLQQTQYIGTIAQLTGLQNIESRYNALSTEEDRRRLFADAQANEMNGVGQLGAASLHIEEATLDAKLATEELNQIPEKIRIEQERSDQVYTLTTNTGYSVAALDVAAGIAGNIPDITIGTNSGTTVHPSTIVQGVIRGAQTVLGALESAKIGETNSAATVKGLLLQMATAALAIERAHTIIKSRINERNELEAELERVVRNYVSARMNLACAYFTNPAYRLQFDHVREEADNRLEAAMVQAYTAAKGLEYEWAERLSNPVQRVDGGLPEPIGDAELYNPIIRAESAFSVRSAGAHGEAAPGLNTFLGALRLWDTKMRFLRAPAAQRDNHVQISVRKDILGLNGADESYNRLAFADFIRKHRADGLNPDNKDLLFPFQLEIADQRFFPARPNVKLQSLQVALVSLPDRSVRPGDENAAAVVTFAMLDTSIIRTFFANFSMKDEFGQARLGDDDLRTIKLAEGRNTFPSPFQADVQASIDGFPRDTAANDQLQNLSPSATHTVLWMDMSIGANRHLDLENLDDIQIQLTYKFGRPRVFTF